MNGVWTVSAVSGNTPAPEYSGMNDCPLAGVFFIQRLEGSRLRTRRLWVLNGGADGAGPVVANGMVYAVSGYPSRGALPGNVLIAFSTEP